MEPTALKTSAPARSFTPELRRRLMLFGGTGIVILIIGGVIAYTVLSRNQIAISNASITAPLIELAPTAAGRLNAVYVNEGDRLLANAPVALVGTEVIKTKVAGIIVSAPSPVGAQLNPGQAVVEMIDPSQLRVVGKLDENKGLSKISAGDPVVFTVDAFGGKKFHAVVDEVAPTSNQSGIVFNISSQRQIQQFDIKARFDTDTYPELKNGMSARMWVYPR